MCPYYLYYLVLLSNKDNKDTYFVVFDGFRSILLLLHNGMENAKSTVKNTTARFQGSSAVQIRYSLFWVVTQRVLVVV